MQRKSYVQNFPELKIDDGLRSTETFKTFNAFGFKFRLISYWTFTVVRIKCNKKIIFKICLDSKLKELRNTKMFKNI